MLVALKFCGGCNPGYERRDYWEAIARAAGPDIQWTNLEDRACQAVLLVCGCDTACPEKEMPPGLKLVCLKIDRLPPEEVVGNLLKEE